MRSWRLFVLILASGAAMVAGGVATNQVLDDGELDWHWAYLAFGLMVLVSVYSLHAASPDPFGAAGQGASRVRWGSGWTYRRQLRASVADMETIGVLTQSEFVLRMEQVYVDVALRPRPAQETEGDAGVGPEPPDPADRTVGRRGPLSSFLDQGRVFAVMGAPGSGKTTLVRHTALELCRWRPTWRRRRLPVLLYLRDHGEAILDGQGLPEVAASVTWLQGRIPASWLARRLDRGRCLVLLDGLDEIAEEAARRRVVTWVRQQIDRYPRNVFVVTSRPHGYTANKLPNADELQVQRFTVEQISRFLHAWHRAVEQRARQGAAGHIRQIADRQAEDLLERLRGQPALYDLAANPLLLTMIANVHRYRNKLPGSRAELYAEMCDVLLHRRQEAKDLTDPTGLSGPQKTVVMRHLAAHMMSARIRDIPKADAEWVIGDPLAEVCGRQTLEPGVFLEEVRKSGLLVEREHGRYGFAHLTLQEYLTAAHIRQNSGLRHLLTDNTHDPWWRETTLLWAADADATPVIDACLDSGTVRALTLAFDCAEEARQVHPSTRARLDRVLTDDADAESAPQRQRLIAAVTASRTLRADSALALNAHPVTAELWAMFVQHEREQGRHTPEEPADTGDPKAPAVGIWADDARRFLTWLNDLFEDGTAYRFPAPADTARIEFDAALARHTFWSGDARQLRLHRPPQATWPYAAAPGHVNRYLTTLGRRLIRLVEAIGDIRDETELRRLLAYGCLHAAPSHQSASILNLVHTLDFVEVLYLLHWISYAMQQGLRSGNSDDLDRARELTPYLLRTFIPIRARFPRFIPGYIRDLAENITREGEPPHLQALNRWLTDELAATVEHALVRARELGIACDLDLDRELTVDDPDFTRVMDRFYAQIFDTALDYDIPAALTDFLPHLCDNVRELGFDRDVFPDQTFRVPFDPDVAFVLRFTPENDFEEPLIGDPAFDLFRHRDFIEPRVHALIPHRDFDRAFARVRARVLIRLLSPDLGRRPLEVLEAQVVALYKITSWACATRPARPSRARRGAASLEDFLTDVVAGSFPHITDSAAEDPIGTLRRAAAELEPQDSFSSLSRDTELLELVRFAHRLIGPILERSTPEDRNALIAAGACLVAVMTQFRSIPRTDGLAGQIARVLGTLIMLIHPEDAPDPNQMLLLVRDS